MAGFTKEVLYTNRDISFEPYRDMSGRWIDARWVEADVDEGYINFRVKEHSCGTGDIGEFERVIFDKCYFANQIQNQALQRSPEDVKPTHDEACVALMLSHHIDNLNADPPRSVGKRLVYDLFWQLCVFNRFNGSVHAVVNENDNWVKEYFPNYFNYLKETGSLPFSETVNA